MDGYVIQMRQASGPSYWRRFQPTVYNTLPWVTLRVPAPGETGGDSIKEAYGGYPWYVRDLMIHLLLQNLL